MSTNKAPKEKVIDLVHGAEETSSERLLKKHVPAWVVSGAIHVAITLVALAINFFAGNKVVQSQVPDVGFAADEQKEAPPPPDDLTILDPGFDSTIETSLQNENENNKNVEEEVNMKEPIGVTNPTDPNAANEFKPVGAVTENSNQGNPLENPGVGIVGDGGQNGLIGGSSATIGRSGATKNKLLEQYGGNKESELAVARGLLWLSKQQRQDGTWAFDGTSAGEVAGATALALLPFLAAGQTHIAKKDQENKYIKNVQAGLNALMKLQKQDGSFKGSGHGQMYSHGIATVALCEAFGMTQDNNLKAACQSAVNFIVAAQGPDGGWRYAPKQEGDTSVVGWMVQGLQSAKMCKDLVVSKAAIDGATKFLDKAAAGSDKETYGYTGPGASPALTAVGLLCRYYINGWSPSKPGMIKGVNYLMKTRMPDSQGALDMYYYYYATQVLHFYEGDEWHKEWNPKMRDRLIKLQVTADAKAPNYGSWDKDSGHIGSHCGRLGTTCLALLTLEVYYRHIPLYKRDSGGLKQLEQGLK